MAKKSKAKVTCWECKKVFKGEPACASHAEAKKHKWQPPSRSAPKSTVVSSNLPTVTGGAPSTSVTSTIVTCLVCHQRFGSWHELTTHYSVFHIAPHLPLPILLPCSVCQEFVSDRERHYMLSPKHPKCTACSTGFENAAELQKHLATRDTCDVCNVHLPPSITMDVHYWTSPYHPKCIQCWVAFEGMYEFGLHRSKCPATATQQAVSTGLGMSAATSSSVSQSSGPVVDTSRSNDKDNHRPETDGALGKAVDTGSDHEGYQADIPAEKDEPQQACPDPSADGLGPEPLGTDNSSDCRSPVSHSGRSLFDTNLSTPTLSEASELMPDLGSTAVIPKQSVIGNGQAVAPGAGSKSLDRPQVQGNLESNYRLSEVQATALTFRCRSCFRNPCQEPVATVCGHIFCQGCIILSLSTRMACPVCDRPYFIRLDLPNGL